MGSSAVFPGSKKDGVQSLFVIPTELMDGENLRASLDLIRSSEFRQQVCAMVGYEVTETGNVVN